MHVRNDTMMHMQITRISPQARDPERVNIYIDGAYSFSLHIDQMLAHKLKAGVELTLEHIAELKDDGTYSRIYARALEWALARPRSTKELRDYLHRKTLPKRGKDGRMHEGVSPNITDRCMHALLDKEYVNDEKFTTWWVETRHQRKGISTRKLRAELQSKGVTPGVIEQALATGPRDDREELRKIIAKKQHRYDTEQKLIAYLARQGFSYDDIRAVLNEEV